MPFRPSSPNAPAEQEPRPQETGRRIQVVGAAIVEDGACLVAQRHPRMTEPLKWEFPGGKVEPGESPRQALEREIREELGLEIEVGRRLGRGRGGVGELRIELEVYLAVARGGRLHLAEHLQTRWIRQHELDELDWAAADRPILPALRRILQTREGKDNENGLQG